jgi:putative DNA methylase
VMQHVTFRLADSLPTQLLRELEAELPIADPGMRRQRIAALLEAGHGACLLHDARAAAAVQDSLLFHDGTRYRLLAWVVMPNHVHVVLETSLGYGLSSIMQTLKGYTAHEVNRLLGRAGQLWMPESFDRMVRDEDHLRRAIHYVHMNPVTAGLCAVPEQWPFSSAQMWKHRLEESLRPAGG